jgi:hypothetical protein
MINSKLFNSLFLTTHGEQFNLETPDCDLFTNDARMPYRAISLAPAPGPLVLEIQVLLAVPELPNDQVLVYAVPDVPRVKVEPARRFILLEAWTLGMEFDDRLVSTGHLGAEGIDMALPTIYKHGIVLFRSLFSLLRILPAWKLYKRLKRRTGGINRNGKLSIQLRVRPQGEDANDERDVLKFGVPPAPSQRPLPTETHTFPPVPHALGNFTMGTTYLTAPHFFQLEERETLLFSSEHLLFDKHFASAGQQGEGSYPTLESMVAAFGAPVARSSERNANRQKQHRVGSHSHSYPVRDTSNSSPAIPHVFFFPNTTVPHNQQNTSAYAVSSSSGPCAPIPTPIPIPIPARASSFGRNSSFRAGFTDSSFPSRVHLLTSASTSPVVPQELYDQFEFLNIRSLDRQEQGDILPHEMMEANNLFLQLDPDRKGYIETAIAAKFLMGCGLPQAELGRVWYVPLLVALDLNL